MKKGKKKIQIQNVWVTGYAAEGKALCKIDGKVIFISGAVPGDEVDIVITKNKKDWAEAKVEKIITPSTQKTEPFCQHFGICGGCKWQMLPYALQLKYKQQEAEQILKRIGKVDLAPILPIIGAEENKYYRNKLEFTFSNKEYFTTPPSSADKANPLLLKEEAMGALGFHVPRLFDKIIDIQECYLMNDINNVIRNKLRHFAIENNFSFYDIRHHTGWLRNLIVRYCTTGELMINICLNFEDENNRKKLLQYLLKTVPTITTLLYTINPKFNDTLYDLEPQIYYGKGFVMESIGDFKFKISPKSFFQTNTTQAEKLYTVVKNFAALTGTEIVYDLYCGTGSIGIFLSKNAKKIIGVEVIEDAIKDAQENAALNNINHAHFFAGDVIKICDDDFFAKHGRPDVLITDPPRVGMHDKLINKLLSIEAPKIVYVSCNIATQARDIALLSEKYLVQKVQPVDMFPHTHHIESVALLLLK